MAVKQLIALENMLKNKGVTSAIHSQSSYIKWEGLCDYVKHSGSGLYMRWGIAGFSPGSGGPKDASSQGTWATLSSLELAPAPSVGSHQTLAPRALGRPPRAWT